MQEISSSDDACKTYKLRQGSFYRLERSVNAIPDGIYRLDDVDDCFMHFRIGKSVHFSLSLNCLPFLSAVSGSEARRKSTIVSDFVDRYYNLLPSCRDCAGEGLYTMCALSPHLAREVH